MKIAPLALMEDHDEALSVWRKAKLKNAVLVHIDAHPDFSFIARRRPQEILRVKTTAAVDKLLQNHQTWNFSNRQGQQLIHSGNYLFAAIQEKIVREFYWIVPDPYWDRPANRRALISWIKRLFAYHPQFAATYQERSDGLRFSIDHCQICVQPLCCLKDIRTPVLLNIDIDYFVTRSCRENIPYFRSRARPPWRKLSSFLQQWGQKRITSRLTTICYSVNHGFTPLSERFLADHLALAFANPHQPVADAPRPGSAAEFYRKFAKALASNDLPKAKFFWRETVLGDPKYRTKFAIPGLFLEGEGRLKEALKLYQFMQTVDPTWQVPKAGVKRVRKLLATKSPAARRAGLLCRRLESETLLVNLEDHWLVRLNPVAALIWRQLQAGANQPRIVKSICESFAIDRTTAKKDVRDFKRQLRQGLSTLS